MDLTQLPSVEIDPNRLSGQPVLAGTRVSAAQILAELAENHTPEQIAKDLDIKPDLIQNLLTDLANILKKEEPEEQTEPWHCHLCFPEGEEISYLGSGLSLIYDGQYKLIGDQGHKAFYIFPIEPFPDPDLGSKGGQSKEEVDALFEDGAPGDVFFKQLFEPFDELKFELETGEWLCSLCRRLGWTGRGAVTCWLMDYCGKLVQEWKNKKNGL